MSLAGIIKDDYGQILTLTIQDVDTESAADISGFTTLQMKFTSPSGISTTKTAAFVTDGTNGQIKYTVEDELLDEAGIWWLRAILSAASQVLSSNEISFKVWD